MTGKKKNEEIQSKTAVALEYNPNERAPKIIASGRGYLAEKIIEKAKEANVPLHEDKKLASSLAKIEVGDMIPPELYTVVAEILAYVDDCDKIKRKISEKN